MYFVILSAQLVDGYGSFKIIFIVVYFSNEFFGECTEFWTLDV